MDRYAIIVAGGSGSRMGGDLPKQFMLLEGKPVVLHTIERFLLLPFPVEIVLILPSAYREYWKDYCFENNLRFKHTLVSGGITRFHSVKNALKYIPRGAVVAVHDGVRPFIAESFLERLFTLGEEVGAVVPAVKPVDSIRMKCAQDIEKDTTDSTEYVQVDREQYLLVQTPQVFRSDILLDAYEQAFIPSFTDDASVVEKMGCKISITDGLRHNIKLTQTEDMVLAEAIMPLTRNGRDLSGS